MPNSEKLDALRTGIDLAIAGHVGAAKFWLLRASPDAAAALMLARLYARSRSVRASRRAVVYLSHAMQRAEQLDLAGRQEVSALATMLMKRNFDPYGCPVAPSAELVELQRYRRS